MKLTRVILLLLVAGAGAPLHAAEPGSAWVRHAPVIRGRVDGSVQVMVVEDVTLSGTAVVTGALRLPGHPTVKVAGAAGYGALLDVAAGLAVPAAQVTLEGAARVQSIVRGVEPIPLARPVPLRPVTGTRVVTLLRPTDAAGDFATIKNLTIAAGAGSRAIPPGVYGDLTLEGKTTVALGVVGATSPAFYQFTQMQVAPQASLIVVGPVVVTLGSGLSAGGTLGAVAQPEWLRVNVVDGDVTLAAGAAFYGRASVPTGAVSLAAKASWVGALEADRLVIDGGAELHLTLVENRRPVLAWVAPAEGARFVAPADIEVRAAATDVDGVVTRVEFLLDGQGLAELRGPPWVAMLARVPAGAHLLLARASDDLGAMTESVPRRVVVDGNHPPVVALIEPPVGAAFEAPATFPMVAAATDADGVVQRVEFWIDGTLTATVAAPPYQAVASGLGVGVHRIKARAFDPLGAMAESAEVSVAVTRPNVPPVVALTGSWGATTPTAPAEVTLSASATDADGMVTRVAFLRDGVSVGEAIQEPFRVTLAGLAAGTYVFTARATDDRGASSTASSVVLTVNQAPTVGLTQPVAGAVFDYPASVALAAEAADADGAVTGVEFWRSGEKVATALAAPFTGLWRGMAPGEYVLTARATDDRGATAVSFSRTIQVRVVIPYFTGFEASEGYPPGGLAGLVGWTAIGLAQLEPGAGRAGTQALRVGGSGGAGEARRGFPAPTNAVPVLFAECRLRPTAGDLSAESVCLRLGPSTLALVRVGAVATFQFLSGADGGTWVGTGIQRAVDAAGQAVDWTRVTVRQDFGSKKWDLWLDGQLVAVDVVMSDPAASEFGAVVVAGRSGAPTLVDDFYVGPDNPLFVDADRDGMDDAWESAHGLDPHRDDRDDDPDGDGLSNIREYLWNTDPRERDTDGDGLPDGWEVTFGLNPRRFNRPDEDLDGDGIGVLDEFRLGTDPRRADTDGDGIADGLEVLMGSDPRVADLATMPSRWRGVRLHLRADAGVVADADGLITSWKDQSSTGWTATAASPQRAPRRHLDPAGRMWVQFDGFDDWLSLPDVMAGAVAGSVFAVVQLVAPVAAESRTLWTLGATPTLYPHESGGVQEGFGRVGGRLGPVVQLDLTQPHLYEVVATASSWTSRINGLVYATTLSNAVAFSPAPTLGYSGGANFGRAVAGGVAELICFDRELTVDERQAVERYLNVRHRLVATLPASPPLEAIPCGAGQVCLMWSGGVDGWSTRYELERQSGGQPWQRVAVVEDASSYIDVVDAGFQGSVAYRIRAATAAGASGWSAVVSAVLEAESGDVVLPRAGLRLWLKADAGVPLGRVSRWPDGSGRGQDALSNPNWPVSRWPVAEAGVLRGRPAVRFDGYDDCLELPATLLAGVVAGECWAVLRAADLPTAENRTLWRLGSADTFYPSQSGAIFDAFGSSSLQLGPAPREDLGTWQVYHVVAESGRWTSRLNGRYYWTSAGNAVAFGTTPTLGYSGGANFGRSFSGHVAEILIYDRTLNEAERQAVSRYLQVRHGLADAAAIPSGIKIAPVGSSQAQLSWGPQIGAWARTIELQRQSSETPFVTIASLPDASGYLDRGLMAGGVYRYRLRTRTPAGISAWSEPVTVQLPSQGASMPLASLRLWLSADAGLVPGRVGLWLDQSGRGGRGFQPTADFQPEAVIDAGSGRLRVRFDALNDSLVLDPFLASMSEGEVFAVLKARTAQPVAARTLWTFGAGRTLYPHDSGRVFEGFGSTTTYDEGGPRVALDALHLYNVAARGGDWVSRLNGGSYFARSANTVSFPADPSLGYSGSPNYGASFDGELAELMVFDHVLTAAERDVVGRYLAVQHGLAASLAPPVPQGVILEQISATQVRVAWNPIALAGGSAVALERSVDGAAYLPVAEVAARNAIVDRGLPSGGRVRYRLRARSLGGLSDYAISDEVSVLATAVSAELPWDGVRLWLRADHGVELQSGAVAIWRDQSGLANDALQLEAAYRPAASFDDRGGVMAVRFDGLDDRLALPDVLAGAAAGEILAVLGSASELPLVPRGLWRFGANGAAQYPDAAGLLQDDFGSPVARVLLPSPWPLNRLRLLDLAAGQDRWSAWLNGLGLHDSLENTVSFRPDPLVGHNGAIAWAGEVRELLVYDRILRAAEREAAGAYLTRRHALPDLTVPPAPTEFRVAAAFPLGVALTWNARVDGVGVRFVVERQEPGGSFQVVGLVANTLAWLDAGVVAGRAYVYRLKALTFAGSSSYSGTVAIVLAPDADGDGLPDAWEIWAGTNLQAADAQADPDGDGLTNRQEYRLGSNPLRAATADPSVVNLRVYQPQR